VSRRRSRGRGGTTRRRAHPVEDHAASEVLIGGPQALYRAEKARRASNVDAAIMAEAKRLYDEAVAESTKKRAGMRSAVVPPGQRRVVGPDAEAATPEVAEEVNGD
jgi:hypothetical protein